MTDRAFSPSTSTARLTIVWALGLGYGAVLAGVAFWPSPVDRPVRALLDRAILELHERGVPTFVDYSLIEFAANILLFVPVGLFFGLALPNRAWFVAALLGPLVSGWIEGAQLLLLDQRYATVNDVIANSLGATAGLVVAVALRAVVAARDQKVIIAALARERANSIAGRTEPLPR